MEEDSNLADSEVNNVVENGESNFKLDDAEEVVKQLLAIPHVTSFVGLHL